MTATEITSVALHEATRHRYLNYALSVITSRALPDVRDGLKPVQRRILYAMYNNLRLLPDGRYRKSAAVVGEVMAKYHPHGDSSIYDAMVRLAQPFSLRHMLVDGQGNFGSLDGDGAAAMRYTECRLRPLAVELLSEIKQKTVDFRPNYDGQYAEPVVLPAQFPQLLVNGAEGIAVGMATRIPPHNLREVIDAANMLIDEPDTENAKLCRRMKGPDFPTGGIVLNSPAEIAEMYAEGKGSIQVRGRWTTEKHGRRSFIVVSEIPYNVNKATLVEKIGDLIASRALPQLVDVRDESTDDVRIVLELRKMVDSEAAMAFLFKKTQLQVSYHINLTCLFPSDVEGICAPERANLHRILSAWLQFRHQTVRRRFEFELQKLKERIHILEGFAKVFDALDEAIRIIRGSEGKRDAAEQLMFRFELDDIQVDAILELRLYKLAKLEILAIMEELEEKRAEAAQIEAILASDQELWAVVKTELQEIRKLYGERRRTDIGSKDTLDADQNFDKSAYIVAERTNIIVTRDGWIKRLGRITDVEKIRVKEGDSVAWIAQASTKNTVAFYSTAGIAYVMRIANVPSTTGYGEPVQRHFNFADKERVVGVSVHDPRALPTTPPEVAARYNDENPPPPHGVAMSRKGRIIRFPLKLHLDPSTKNGRRFMRPDGKDDAVVSVFASGGTEMVSIASEQGRALCFPVEEINVVKGSGKGLLGMKLRPDDRIIAFELTTRKFNGAQVTTSQGREETIRPSKFLGKRAGRGKVVLKRGRFMQWHQAITRMDKLHADDAMEDMEDMEDDSDEITEEGATIPGSPPAQTHQRSLLEPPEDN